MIDKRPWGIMLKLWHTRKLWIKLIYVKKGKRTSLQYHEQRTEFQLTKKGWNKISPWEHHRLEHGFCLEIAIGLPRENDITRLEDDYDRT
ncbi:MAG: hypothetical protein ACE5H1_07530 [Thermodesulfobacteriota bacterium]